MNKTISTSLLITILVIAAPFFLLQSTWIFKDSKKRGSKYYWLWGLFGLLNLPESLIVYLIITRIIIDKKYKKKA